MSMFTKARELLDFHRKNVVVAAVIWLLAVLFAFLVTRGAPTLLLSFTAGLAGVFTLQTYTQRLLERSRRATGPSWDVLVNDVNVGTIGDATLASIQRDVALDKLLYDQQMRNIGSGLWHAASSLVSVIPMLAFWGGLAFFLIDPEASRNAVAAVAKASAVELQTGMKQLLHTLAAFWAASTTLLLLFSLKQNNMLGIQNQFRAAVAARVRQAVQCAADGVVVVMKRPAEPAKD